MNQPRFADDISICRFAYDLFARAEYFIRSERTSNPSEDIDKLLFYVFVANLQIVIWYKNSLNTIMICQER